MGFLTDPRVQFAAGVVLATALFVHLVQRVLRRHADRLRERGRDPEHHFLGELLRCAMAPLSLLVWVYGLQALARVAVDAQWVPADWQWLSPLLRNIALVGLLGASLWFLLRAIRLVDERLRRVAAESHSKFDDVLFPLIGTALRVTLPILAVFLLLRLWPLSENAMIVVRRSLGIALIAALTWTLRRAIVLVDAVVLGPGGLGDKATVQQRALFTRVRMLRRIALVLLTTFAFAAVLMMFDEVRDVGRSILASAGIAGIVLGFAAQRTLGNLFAGIQIALTQPIRLGDQVIVEGEFATIEELTLTYVVARTWDARRLILPISYFIEKPFQNWTRGAANLLAPLVLKVDFSLPVDEFRAFMQEEIAKSAFWDKAVFGVQVVESDENCMQVRVLASAPDSGAAWNLRCELREKAIDFIRQNHPECLPKIRQEQHKVDAWRATTGLTDGNAPLVIPERPAAARKK